MLPKVHPSIGDEKLIIRSQGWQPDRGPKSFPADVLQEDAFDVLRRRDAYGPLVHGDVGSTPNLASARDHPRMVLPGPDSWRSKGE